MRKPPPIVIPPYAPVRIRRILHNIPVENCAALVGAEPMGWIAFERGTKSFCYDPDRFRQLAAMLGLSEEETQAAMEFRSATPYTFTHINKDSEYAPSPNVRGKSARKPLGKKLPRIWQRPQATELWTDT